MNFFTPFRIVMLVLCAVLAAGAYILRFHLWGFAVKTVLRRSDFDREAQNADVCILYYRWLKKYRYGAHFVALHHTPEGFVGYNTYRTSTGPDKYGPSLEAFLKKRKYFGAVLFCIQKR
jgi:hypothetical protein